MAEWVRNWCLRAGWSALAVFILSVASAVAPAFAGEPAAFPPSLAVHRYVALGDSVPYGHGLANPNKGPDSGLKPEQGPSSEAWPNLVDKGVPGLASLKQRPTSCRLIGPRGARYDQLAFSGAPTQPNMWTDTDSTCIYPKGQKVMERGVDIPGASEKRWRVGN